MSWLLSVPSHLHTEGESLGVLHLSTSILFFKWYCVSALFSRVTFDCVDDTLFHVLEVGF